MGSSQDVVFDLRVYRLTAIQKAGYRFADRVTVILGVADADRLPATLQFKPTTSESAAREITRLFYQELLDQELREQIAEQTNAVRTLILAHAFSNVDLIERG